MYVPAPEGFEGRPPRDWPVPPMDHSAGGRESAYTPAMARLILARVLAGETVKAICADPRTPAYCTVYQWIRVVPEFAEAWGEVRRALAQRRMVRVQEERAAAIGKRALLEGVGLKRPYRGGRRSTYSAAMARKICAAVAAGAPISHVLAAPGMPSHKAVYGWLRAQPAFRRRYAEACRQRALGLTLEIDRVIDLVMDAPPGTADLAAASRAVARIEGRIGRLTPKTYRPGAVV